MGSPPVPGLIAGEGTIYTKTISSVSQLFYTNDASGNQYQLTRNIPASFSLFSANVNNYNPGTGAVGTAYTAGWTYLPGGLLFQYGTYFVGAGISTTGTIKFPVVYTNPPFNIILTLISKSGGSVSTEASVTVEDATVAAADFGWKKVNSSSSHVGIYWTAIGK